MIKKIAIAGYHFTGCGVLDDLFREFDNVAQAESECESRFLQEADGVSDLEYHLVENPHRKKIDLAIIRFLRYCKKNSHNYERIYGRNWYKICEDYIDSLLKFQYKGYILSHLEEKSSLYLIYYRWITRIQRFIPQKWRFSKRKNYFPKETIYHAMPTEEDFLEKTRAFTERLAQSMITNKKAEYVMIDQMFAGNNPDRYLRYVNDVKAFVVDRDPRDLYINQRNMQDHMLPVDPHQFCVHFRDIRKHFGCDNPNVMYLNIEDMIYHYDEMVPKVCEFVGIDMSHHVLKKQYFDPSISIMGTKTWERYPQYKGAIEVIEKELSDYLYDYSELDKS
jgi:hypothetical protein